MFSKDDIHDSASMSALPYSHSRFELCARAILGLTTLGLTLFFGYQWFTSQGHLMYFWESAVLLLMLLWTGGPPILRVGVLISLTANIASVLVNAHLLPDAGNAFSWPLIYGLLASLIVCLIFESVHFFRSSVRMEKSSILFWLLLTIPAFVYIICIPITFELISYLQTPEDSVAQARSNQSFVNEASFRFAKFSVFAIFSYLGACFGSFLNVVAHSLPRGESAGLRDSACPICKTKLRRIDNLPIFSYLNLGGKCRNCKTQIPMRYLIVEVIAMTILASLFAFELVKGCENIPLFDSGSSRKGVLSIVLFPNWTVIGIYFFHAIFMCGLLTLALIELDKQTLKWWQLLPGFAIVVFCIALFPDLLPTPALEKLPFESPLNSPWLLQLMKPVLGGLVALVFGLGIGKLLSSPHWQLPAVAFASTGAVLGWQGILQVAVIIILFLAAGLAVPRLRKSIAGRPTFVLLAAVVLHQPVWRILFDLW